MKPQKKSIRQVAFERRQKLGSQSNSDAALAVRPSIARRAIKLWSQPDEREMGEEETVIEQRPQNFKWVRGESIGRGTHGRVYLGLDAITGEIIAVKQISFAPNADQISGRPCPRTIKQEMENMKGLSHPNLVDYLGIEEGGEFLSLFMEHVAGGSLRAAIQKFGALDADVVKSFTSQILDGLIYLHARGLVHGDLKSSNVLLEPTGICKIEGLGCTETEIRDNSWAVPRAIFWTAPEIIKTQYKAYDAMADIWSLGCIVLEMLTGKRPWANNEAVAVMYKLYHQTLRPLPPADFSLDAVAADFTEKCLALQPEDRLSAVQLKHHPFLLISPNWSFNGFPPAL
ncbi:kinase-like domain-containing protein [Mycena capillaripes]|nr:kinase-like domain-containing protein [Mycena capillaripes]